MGKEATGTVTTYLDFGQTIGGRRTSYDYYEGQPAYDLFMGARYVFDMIAYRRGEIAKVYQREDLRDQHRKYAGLVAARSAKKSVFYEVGSSVMGVIDALEYLNKKYKQLNIKNITFAGVDNSTWMNEVARYTHEQYKLKLFYNPKDAGGLKSDLFFAKGVSLMYAFADAKSLCRALQNSRLALFDYTFSRKGTVREFVGTGLPVTFLSLDACKKLLETDTKRLIFRPYRIKSYHTDPNKVTYDCIYGDPVVVEKYLKELQKKTGETLDTYGDPKFVREKD